MVSVSAAPKAGNPTAAGLSVEELASRTGLVRQQITDYERGGSEPKWETLVKLLRVLGPEMVTTGFRKTRTGWGPGGIEERSLLWLGRGL
jgi:transcriptional regulator with XRE-family HTH domain